MAAGNARVRTNDHEGSRVDTFMVTVRNAGALAAAKEDKILLPPSGENGIEAGNGWVLVKCLLDVGVNTTHSTSTPLVSATVEKNTDGGTSALTTIPSISDAAGTGRKTTAATATGIVPAVIATGANAAFADGDAVFVTLLETGATGSDPEDVALQLVFARQQDFDPFA